jgi:hypothetical protein
MEVAASKHPDFNQRAGNKPLKDLSKTLHPCHLVFQASHSILGSLLSGELRSHS